MKTTDKLTHLAPDYLEALRTLEEIELNLCQVRLSYNIGLFADRAP